MILKALVLENFRAYRNRTYVEFDDLTAFVGKNDYGKSTVLEALEIFFNNEVVKIEGNDRSVRSDSTAVRIGCVFDDVPEKLVLDETAETTLQSEFLLNSDGCLEVHKLYDVGKSKIAPKVFACAEHPTREGAHD